MRFFYLLTALPFAIVAIQANAANQKTAFSLVYNCGTNTSPRYCLADPTKHGLNIVLVKKNSTVLCSAKTSDTFFYEHPIGHRIKSTSLVLSKKCAGPFSFAILYENQNTIKFPLVRTISTTPKAIDIKVRKLLEHSNTPDIYHLAQSSPRIISANKAILFLYNYVSDPNSGPGAIILKGNPYRIDGDCIRKYRFFSIKKRLYIQYRWSGCNSGQIVTVIYDLSSDRPKKVYVNGALSS